MNRRRQARPVAHMPKGSSHEVTELLTAWSHGDEGALDRLVPLVHVELHRLAKRYMARERRGHTLQTTALVNEAYLRLVDSRNVQWQNRTHFFAIAAQLMRRILIDHARRRRYAKRGGGALRVSLEDTEISARERGPGLIALDDALTRLSCLDSRKGQVVELRFFGGLSVDETAEVVKVSPATVLRDWRMAKAWLLRELSRQGPHET